jgi:hypothetical protein
MKYFLVILLLVSVLPAQEINDTWSVTVTLDSSDTETRYLYFPEVSWTFGRKSGTYGFNATAQTPSNNVHAIDQFLGTVYVDSLKASTALDSIWIGFRHLDKDGYVFGDTTFFDWSNNDSTASETFLGSIVPFNRTTPTLGSSSPNGWAEFSGLLKPSHGLEFIFHHTGIGGTNDSLAVKLNLNINRAQ